MNPATDMRRVRRLEAELSSFSSGSGKAVQDLEKAVAELAQRVANLESQAIVDEKFIVTVAAV